ncbi:MAG: class I tRNA ligase family protein, partial [Bacteroidaceae bacterium]|nr:class I tRNA ligase family protein [Bacteroidaceae bacterium]
ELPPVDKFLPTETGEPPLGHATRWAWDTLNKCITENSRIDQQTVFPLELNTMPGFAGSSAYYLRYMDPHNAKALVDKQKDAYWRCVDLYIGGTEHATGHLIYSRFWNKFLHDYGWSCEEEPFHKLVNQGMIQGRSNFVYRVQGTNKFVSVGLKDQYEVTPIHVDVNMVQNDILDIEAFKAWRPDYHDAEFILENGKYVCGWAIEKMSKSMFNVVNPDYIVDKYGADTLRLYEMFLGPIRMSKPWDSNGIDGCLRFLRKVWNLFWNRDEEFQPQEGTATVENLKSINRLIQKVSQDMEDYSYNTSISAFMICVSELAQQKCTDKEVLGELVRLLAPYAPHIAEELWEQLGNATTVCDAAWPICEEKYLKEESETVSISFNGKTRFTLKLPTDISNDDAQKEALKAEAAQKYLEGKQIVKIIVVPHRIVNIVIK